MNGSQAMITKFRKAERPTLYFVGITATASSIMRIFPRWAELLQLGACDICGIDLPKPCDSAVYRAVLDHILVDALSLGAVVTSHKMELYDACREDFDELDDYARITREVSCISKREGRLIGQAKDPVTSGLALETFLPNAHWTDTHAWVLILGAGGSALAVSLYLSDRVHGRRRPARILVSNRGEPRLRAMADTHREQAIDIPVEYHMAANPSENDALVELLPPHSLIINATGLGKDTPGSPLTDRVVFPAGSLIWDFNARGDLRMLAQARAQEKEQQLIIEDGWRYFLFGWTQHIAEIFHIDIPAHGRIFDALRESAESCRV